MSNFRKYCHWDRYVGFDSRKLWPIKRKFGSTIRNILKVVSFQIGSHWQFFATLLNTTSHALHSLHSFHSHYTSSNDPPRRRHRIWAKCPSFFPCPSPPVDFSLAFDSFRLHQWVLTLEFQFGLVGKSLSCVILNFCWLGNDALLYWVDLQLIPRWCYIFIFDRRRHHTNVDSYPFSRMTFHQQHPR
jgi:hypothetical protein